METLIVLGTGTDVGKTFVCCCIASELRRATPDLVVRGLKPVESGLAGSEQARDAAALAAAAGHAYISPAHAFQQPLSPHLLARNAGVNLDPSSLARWAQAQALGADRLIIESAGGAFSPLSDSACNADLVLALRSLGMQPKVILVANNRLGVLHDVLATQRALAAMSAAAELIVLNAPTPQSDASAESNATELRLLQPARVEALEHGSLRPDLLAAGPGLTA